MKQMNDDLLINTYKIAYESSLSEEFLFLLLEEINRRELTHLVKPLEQKIKVK